MNISLRIANLSKKIADIDFSDDVSPVHIITTDDYMEADELDIAVAIFHTKPSDPDANRSSLKVFKRLINTLVKHNLVEPLKFDYSAPMRKLYSTPYPEGFDYVNAYEGALTPFAPYNRIRSFLKALCDKYGYVYVHNPRTPL